MFRKLIVVLLLSLMAMGCASEPAAPETITMTLPMGYIPDPQFAPIYVALEKGYFAEEGFEIELDYSFETDGVALVGAGRQPFALVSGDVVLSARAEEVPIVYVAEWWQQYPIAVVSKSDAGISTPTDLVDRAVGIPGLFGATYVGYSGLLAASNITPDQVNLEELGFNQIEALLTDQVEAALVYANNEPVQLGAMGEDISVIRVADYLDMVATGIVTNETFAAENPERVKGFVRAFLRGLDDTLNNPDEAFEISGNYIEGLDDSRRGVLDASLAFWGGEPLGYTDSTSWEVTQDTLIGMGFLAEPLSDLDAAFTNDYLP